MIEPIFPMVEEPRYPPMEPKKSVGHWFGVAGSILIRLSALLMTIWFVTQIISAVTGNYVWFRPYFFMSHVFAIIGIIGFYLWWMGHRFDVYDRIKVDPASSPGWTYLTISGFFVSGFTTALLLYMIHWSAHDYYTKMN